MKANQVATSKISEILLKEFMKPLKVSAHRHAKEIDVPVSRMQDILRDHRLFLFDEAQESFFCFNL